MGSCLPKFTPRGQYVLRIPCPRQHATGGSARAGAPFPSPQFRILPTVHKNACPVRDARRDSCWKGLRAAPIGEEPVMCVMVQTTRS